MLEGIISDSIINILALITNIIIIILSLRGIKKSFLLEFVKDFNFIKILFIDNIIFFTLNLFFLFYLIFLLLKFGLIVFTFHMIGFFLLFNILKQYYINFSDTRKKILLILKYYVNKYNKNVSMIKFDVDMIAVLNQYSSAVGSHIINLLDDALDNYINKFKNKYKINIEKIKIYETDERIVIINTKDKKLLIKFANCIRHYVKSKLSKINNYLDAKQYVINKIKDLSDEEKKNIGTISAGISFYRGGLEQMIADASYAVKIAKRKGRNKTILNTGDRLHIYSDDKCNI